MTVVVRVMLIIMLVGMMGVMMVMVEAVTVIGGENDGDGASDTEAIRE